MKLRSNYISELRKRWTPEVVREINELLARGAIDGVSRLRDNDGKVDLRGIEVSAIVRGCELLDLDFSYSIWKLPSQLINCDVRGCVFDYSRVGSNLGRSFHSCSFVGSKMAHVVLRGRYEACDFSMASLKDAGATSVAFQACRFVEADLRKSHMLYCRFEGCNFSDAIFGDGSLSGSTICDSILDRDSLGNTLLEKIAWV